MDRLVAPIRALLAQRTGLDLHVTWIPQPPRAAAGSAILLSPRFPGRPLPREFETAARFWIGTAGRSETPTSVTRLQSEAEGSLVRIAVRIPIQAGSTGAVLVVFQAKSSEGDVADEPRGGDSESVALSPGRAVMSLLPAIPPSALLSVERLLRRLGRAQPRKASAPSLGGAAASSPDRSLDSGSDRQVPESAPRPKAAITGRRAQRIVEALRSFVASNFSRRLTLDDLAAELKMNPAYLSSLFSRTTGGTIHRYLEEVRMAKAKQLLKAPQSRIREVAGAVGYASADAFRHAFKAYTGLSPSEWR